MSESTAQMEPVQLPHPAVCISRWSVRLVVGAVVVGAVSALAAALVRLSFRGLQWVLTGSSADPPVAGLHLALWRRALTPILGAALAAAVLWMRRRKALRFGREPRPYVEYVEAVRHRHGWIPLVPNGWRTASAAFSVASGAAVGREGSMIQFASAIASVVGRWRGWLSEDDSGRLSFLVACGVAGGVTTAYNAPVAAVFFAAEIVLGGLNWLELPLLGLAAAAGWCVSGVLLGRERLYPCHAAHVRSWTTLLLPVVALMFGVLGPMYQKLLHSLRGAKKLPGALLWSGALVGLLSMIDPRTWGNGDVALRAALGRPELPSLSIAAPALLLVLVLRLLATTACVGTGTVGGVFTPTLFAGGAAGALLAHMVSGGAATLWGIVGMSCLMAAVTHAPLMASLMAVELTGDWRLLPGLVLLNVVAWQVARRLSPYALYAIATQAPQAPQALRGPMGGQVSRVE